MPHCVCVCVDARVMIYSNAKCPSCVGYIVQYSASKSLSCDVICSATLSHISPSSHSVVLVLVSSLCSAQEESTEQYELEVTVSHPEKVGDGMGAYIVYSITTKTTIPTFKSPQATVRRRFSDFLRLHNKMTETHLPKGRIVPPAPEKSVKGSPREGGGKEGEEKLIVVCCFSYLRYDNSQVLKE